MIMPTRQNMVNMNKTSEIQNIINLIGDIQYTFKPTRL